MKIPVLSQVCSAIRVRLKIYLLIVFGFSVSLGIAQNPNDLLNQAPKKNLWSERANTKLANFYQIQQDFNQYWTGRKSAKGQGYKVFKRWETFMAPRVYPSGDMALPSMTYTNYINWQENYSKRPPTEKLAASSIANWTELGPLSKPSGYDAGVGRIDFVRFDPTNNNTIYVGAPDGGLWKSTNGGTNWTTNTDFLTVIGCADLAIDPTNTQNMYLATGNWEFDRRSIGILKSTDGGATWNTTSLVWTALDNYKIRKLLMHPSNPLIMMIATDGGIFRTTDGWATHTQIADPGVTSFYDMEFKPGDPNTVYAVGTDFWKSTDNGLTWTLITSGLPAAASVSRAVLGVTEANAAYVYILMGDVNHAYLGTYRSTDSGASFSLQSSQTVPVATPTPNILNASKDGTGTGGQAGHDLAIAISPVDADLVTIGGISQWRSTNGGVDWTLLSYWLGTDVNYPGEGDGPPDYVHADIQDIVYLPGSSTTMFATCDGGISKSTNNGLNWTDISHDLRVAQQSNIALSATTSGLMVTGLQDIGTLINNGGSWSVINGGDGESAFIDRTNNLNIVTSNPNGAHALSTDGGLTRNDITGLPAGLLFFSPIIQDPVTATKVYAGGRNELYVSTDFTATWTALGTPFGTGGIVQFVVAPSNPAVIYAIKIDAISKSTDSGLTWTNVTSTLPVGSAALMNLAVSNTDPNKVWVVFSGYSAGDKVFKTTDGGSSWANVSAGLPNIPINAIVYKNDTANDEVYIGADIGVYYLDNTLAAVVPFFTDLPRCAVTDLEIFYPTSKLRASTYGRGAWESDLYVAANPEVSLSVSTSSGTEAGTTVVTVTVTASVAVSGAQTVNLAVTGTGITAGDYLLSNTTITIPDGLTMGTVTFTIVNDALVEGPETATLTISSPSAGIILGTTLFQDIAITDDDACPVITINVTENSGTAANDGTTCAGASVTLATSGGGTYAWSTGASTSSINVAPNITTTYTVTVTNNSCVGTATQIITVNPLPTPSITVTENSGTANNDGTTCAGATVNLSTSGGGTYLWSTGATTSSINVAPTITTGYSVTVTNADACSGSATTTITVNPLPTPSITVTENSGTASNDGTTCAGASVTLSTVEIGTYLWSTGATTSTINVAPVITTTYTLTVTNSNGCAGVASTIITVNPASTPAISATEISGTTNNDGTTCAGATVTLATSGGGTYAWSTGATTSSINVAPVITTTYTVTVTNAGCSGMASRTITVNPLPTPTITVGENSGIESNDGTTCAGALVVLSTSGGGTYLWSTGATTSSINVAPTTTTGYSVTVTNADACSGTATTTITVNPLPTPAITVTENSGTPNDGTICSSTSVNLATAGGGTYVWSTGATTSAINVAPVITTTYTVTVTNGNGCSNTASQTIVVNPLVNASLSKNVNTICTGGQVTFTFHESAYPQGTEFTVTADLTDDNGTNPVTLADLINGEQFTFTEGIQFTGNSTFSNIKAVLEVGACEDTISGFTIVVTNCDISIKDPCVCLNNAPIRDNGTYGNVGTFRDTVEVRAPAGQTWSVTSVTGLYENAAGTDPVDLNDQLTEVSPGVYTLAGYHVDSVGYTILVSDGRGNTLSIGNKCYYPDPVFTGLPLFVSPAAPAFNVTGTVANNATGTGTFILNGVPQAGAGSAPTVLSINPALLPLGENTLVYQFDANTAGSQDLSDPGCVQEVRQTFSIAEEKCACLNLNITLDANCQFLLLPSQVSSNCISGTVRVMDNNPGNAGLIDCAGVWTYGLFDANGNIICWGKVTAEDKTAPALVCAPADFTLDCYDVNYVLNNRLTIGNVGATSSPRPAATGSQTINNAEGVAGTGDNCALGLIPPGLVSDNIKNLGYAYFKDNCYSCGCRVTLKWSDKVEFYSCEQMKVNGGYYALISREWTATDCNGMRSSYVQKIKFTRPAVDDFVFNGPGEGKYDRVVEYNSCTPDKSLIKKEDVTPYVCSYFNTSANPRCLFIDQVECNYSVSIKDTEFPICGGKGVKIDRELYVLDWCAGGIVDTFHILIKIGDFTAPTVEYAHGAPFDISTGPMDCTAAIPVSIAGIKTAFGVTIKDNCNLGNISVSVYTKDRYVKGVLVYEGPEDPLCEDRCLLCGKQGELRGDHDGYQLGSCDKDKICWDKVEYAVMNGMMIGLPVGKHLMVIDAFDGCYNASTTCFVFEVKDKIAPIMKCDDDLHVTLSNANGYTNGYAQVSAADIDEGSWDNCKLAWIAVRRNVPDGCAASFIQKGYDTNGNGKLDALPADNDYSKADGFDRNGDGDIADFGETFILKGGKLMTPLADYVEFFCCDLTERVTVELWGGDIYGNTNYCWMDLLIEDKVAPTCIAPWAITVDCDDKGLAQIDDKVASAKIFGDVTITTGSDCAALDTVYSTVKKLKCGYGYIDRIWTLTKQTVKGPISITCTQRIWVNPVHEYNICFPKDVSTDCKTPIIDTVITDELGCDILAVNVHDKRYDASDDECYKIFRTYSVINWCTYDDRCGDPLLQTNISIIDRAVFGNYGKAPIYVLVRDREDNRRDGIEEFYISKDLIHNNADDIRFKPAYCEVADEFYHSFIYTQIIKVYDDTRPVVTGVRDTFCTSPTACTANITKVMTLKDNCTDKVELETQFLMIAPFQTLEAGQMILYSTPRWSTKDLGNGQFEIKVSNLPEGTHDLIVVGRDECGNLSLPTRIPFVVKDCKAPAPICINGLSTGIMPDGNGGGMMAVWASDFVASKIYDCNGQGPETKDGLKLVTKYSINRVGQPVNKDQTGLNFTCTDINNSPILVELHAWDDAGNHDFCISFVELIDSRGVCPGSVSKVSIAGTISTEGNANLQGASITLSGAASQNATTAANGGYSFVSLSQGGDFTVTPQLDKNHLNGVSTFDLVLIQKHILGVQALNSPYKLIAADANNSKSISTLDLIALRKLILNIDTHFANNTSWRFIDATYKFPNPGNPWSAAFPEVVSINDISTNVTANFVAIKVGDVNASASVSSAASAAVRINEDFKLKTLEQNLKSGNEYKVSFTAEDLKNIQGYQFALNLDQSKVELLDIEYGVAKAENFGIFKNEGLITTSWNSKYEPGALFTLVIRAKADAKLSSTLSLNRVVSPEAYDQHNENLGIALNFEGIQANEAYELRQNTPNPFSNETVIGFSLPKATKGTLTVRDVKGALIYKVEGNYAKGNNQVTLKKEQLGPSGVLYYTLQTSDFTGTKKMVLFH